MKYLFFIFICAIVTISCRKADKLTSNNGTKLMTVFNDSAKTWNFGYTDNSITSITPGPDRTPIHPFFYYIQNTTINSVQNITLAPIPNTYLSSEHYTLTSSKLPSNIDEIDTINGVKRTTNLAKFFYRQNTNLLDSVLYHFGRDLFVFKVIYTGRNISEITQNQISNNQSTVINTFNFTYGTTPNVFVNTDSLLYIYTYPYTPLFAQSMVIAAFFAETFSASTFKSITTSGTTNAAGWNQTTISSNMTYTLNANGKIIEEKFDNNIFEFLVGKKYSYSN